MDDWRELSGLRYTLHLDDVAFGVRTGNSDAIADKYPGRVVLNEARVPVKDDIVATRATRTGNRFAAALLGSRSRNCVRR